MAGKIRLLTDEVIGKIAAGEVVERPSAAIKELVENSLDAGASAVTVEIRDGGVSYFRVTDNGSGIQQSEIRMAFERHATSKITRSQDLFAIQTLGFRGEALASIAAVARVTCTTRTRDDVSGLKVVNVGGRIESIEEAACPEGTTFVVRDLFFNTPVRLKFLKKPATEAGYVSDLMMRLILSRPDVSFRYVSNGKTLYHSAGDGKLSSSVFSIYGSEMLRSMREVDGCQSGVLIKGFVGVGESGRSSRAHQSFFINGRYMKSSVLSAGLEAACRERVAGGKYPACGLHLTMPYDMVDVNVHPNKLEVRFQNDQAVAAAVEAAVQDALQEQSVLARPEVLRITPETPAKPAVTVSRQETAAPASVPAVVRTEAVPPVQQTVQKVPPVQQTVQKVPPVQQTVQKVPPVQTVKPAPEAASGPKDAIPASARPAATPLKPLAPLRPMTPVHSAAAAAATERPGTLREPTALGGYAQPVRSSVPPAVMRPAAAAPAAPVKESFLPEAEKPLRIIGAAFGSYILVEYEDNLLLVDQHGVHERLLFDRMMKALDQQRCGQELLIPMIVQVTRREQQLLEEHHDLLAAIGLTVEPFGETEMSIRTIPMILGQPQAGEMLREIIDQLESERGVISLEKRRAGILALACRKAVRGGERLRDEDVRTLVHRMVDEHVTPTSPRGTPLVIALSKTDLDRRFRRLQ